MSTVIELKCNRQTGTTHVFPQGWSDHLRTGEPMVTMMNPAPTNPT